MTHKVNKKGVAIEHPPNNKVRTNSRTGSVQLGPETRYTHTKMEVGFWKAKQKFYTFAEARAKGWVTSKDKKNYDKKIQRAKNKPEMFDPPGLTKKEIKAGFGNNTSESLKWRVKKK